MNRSAVCGVVGLVALGLAGAGRGASAQITKQGNAYLFRMKFSKGEKMSYVINSSGSMPGAAAGQSAMKMTMPMVMTVKDVQGKIATVQMEMGPMMMNGKAAGQQKQTMEVKLDDRGKPAGNSGSMQSVSTQLPEKPLKVGESYSTTNNVNVMGQQFAVKATNKFVGTKRVGARNCAIISTSAAGSGAMKTAGTGTALLDMADGSLVSMTMNQKVTVGQGAQAQTITNNVTITRK
jgi:hypothetical protein